MIPRFGGGRRALAVDQKFMEEGLAASEREQKLIQERDALQKQLNEQKQPGGDELSKILLMLIEKAKADRPDIYQWMEEEWNKSKGLTPAAPEPQPWGAEEPVQETPQPITSQNAKTAAAGVVRFDTNAWLRVFVQQSDLELDSRIDQIKASNQPEETKIAQAKELAQEIARERIFEAGRNDDPKIDYDSLSIAFDNVDWVYLVTPEQPLEDEVQVTGVKKASLNPTTMSEEYSKELLISESSLLMQKMVNSWPDLVVDDVSNTMNRAFSYKNGKVDDGVSKWHITVGSALMGVGRQVEIEFKVVGGQLLTPKRGTTPLGETMSLEPTKFSNWVRLGVKS